MSPIGRFASRSSTGGGASGLQKNAVISSSGVQIIDAASATYRSRIDLTPDYGVMPKGNHTFVKIAMSNSGGQVIGIKSDGTLWYYATSNYQGSAFFTVLDAWTQYGTDTNWQHICENGAIWSDQPAWSFIKGGALYFMGWGSRRQRGDGSTANASSPVLVNNARTWVHTSMGYRTCFAVSSTGEVWATGEGSNYASALGITTAVATYTQCPNLSSVSIVMAAGGNEAVRFLASNGNVYASGRNSFNQLGPLYAGTGTINGPVLTYNGGDISFIGRSTNHFALWIKTNGRLFFTGRNQATYSYNRPDNSTNTSIFSTLLEVGGTGGWTYTESLPTESTDGGINLAIQNGNLYVGGLRTTTLTTAVGGPNTGAWYWYVTSGNVTCAALRQNNVVISCS